MTTTIQKAVLRNYARRIRELRRTHPQATEPGLAPAFQRLLEDLLPTLAAAPALTVVPEFQNPGVGRPDIALKKAGETARAFIEMKSPSKPSDGTRWTGEHDRRQFARFGELANWATCNFHELHLYARAEVIGHGVLVPLAALDPNRSDTAADRIVNAHDASAALRLVDRLAQATHPHATTAQELAKLLAHSARLVRGIVNDRLAELREEGLQNRPLQQVRQEFRDVLYSHPEAAGYSTSDFDTLFSAAFAQTLAFGLLLVREATRAPVDRHAAEKMPAEHPLMRATLTVLSMAPIVQEVGAGFEVMLDTVNGFSLDILALGEDGRDPILYFYEDFLQTFDPEARERFGVYYTPVPVVRYMVSVLDRVLREHLKTSGLADSQVHILDPATGTGTFLLGVADRLRSQASEHGPGQEPLVLQGLSKRMYGFELLVGPYAVAHYRLHHALSRNQGGSIALPGLSRLGIYLTDTLAEPGSAAPAGILGFVSDGIRDERLDANRVKSEQQILAILGNPPYRRLEIGESETLVGSWMNHLWEDLKAAVSNAGWGNQLNTFPELSVAFWRWALWKLFEAPNAPRRGVVAFITNRKFLTGKPYSGLRKMMRERFDRIEIVDLRGDIRRGERAGVESDQGLFAIRVGTAITLAVADGNKAEGVAATVTYTDCWAHNRMSRLDKLEWLQKGSEESGLPGSIEINRPLLDDFRPYPFFNGSLLPLTELFEFWKSGMKSGDDDTYVNFFRGALRTAVETKLISRARGLKYDATKERFYSYRPLDRRWFFNDLTLLNRPGPQMQSAWGDDNVGFYALPSGTGLGPAIWCHGLLPDYHAFRGSYGGYAFPLYDRRPGYNPINLKTGIVTALGANYGMPVKPQAVFDAILALLSATSYATRFAEDLEDAFPHVPFPSAPSLFAEAASLGAEIRAIETFARKPGAKFLKGIAVAKTTPASPLGPASWDDGVLLLCKDGTGRVENIPRSVWEFSVSGYKVLPRWLAAREGISPDADFIPELRDLVARIAELIDLFARADKVLICTLDSPLSRQALGINADPGPTSS